MLSTRFVRRFASKASPRIFVTGSTGQIGTELVALLRQKHGVNNVIASDIKVAPSNFPAGPFMYCDVLDQGSLQKIVVDNKIDHIIHLASLLSAIGERNPQLAMQVNARGIENVLEVARLHKLSVFAPSTIAVFGPDTPKDATPNSTIMRPTTIYGTTKVYLELLGEYYHRKFNVDFRSLRYPGIISAESPPGGGTTDYAVEIFYDVLRGKEYNCFLRDDSALPMMYMTDCLKATIDIMEASPAQLKSRVYNVTGCSFTPKEIAAAIQKHEPNFKIKYAPDFRQAIADSWPKSIDDSQAKKDWNWKPEYDLDKMVSKMLTRLRELQKSGAIKL